MFLNSNYLFLKAQEQHKISQIALDGFGDLSEMLQATMTSIGDAVKECLRGADSEPTVMSKIDAVFNNYKAPFEGVQTAYLQKSTILSTSMWW